MPGIADRLPDLVNSESASQLVDPEQSRDQGELADEIDEAPAPSDGLEHLLAGGRGTHDSPRIARSGSTPAGCPPPGVMIARPPRTGASVTISAVSITVPVVCPAAPQPVADEPCR